MFGFKYIKIVTFKFQFWLGFVIVGLNIPQRNMCAGIWEQILGLMIHVFTFLVSIEVQAATSRGSSSTKIFVGDIRDGVVS